MARDIPARNTQTDRKKELVLLLSVVCGLSFISWGEGKRKSHDIIEEEEAE